MCIAALKTNVVKPAQNDYNRICFFRAIARSAKCILATVILPVCLFVCHELVPIQASPRDVTIKTPSFYRITTYSV